MPFMRYVTNKFMSILTSKIFKINLTEFHTGCKIFSKNFYQSIPIKNTSDKQFQQEFECVSGDTFINIKKMGELQIQELYEFLQRRSLEEN